MVRAIVLVAAVCLSLAGCSVDGGLLDPDSELSQRQRADRAGAARTAEIDGASAATQATMLAFYRSVCSLQARYRADLDTAEHDAGQLSPAQYRDKAAAILNARATAASAARATAAHLPIPNMFPDEWRWAQTELTSLFDGLHQADLARATEMAGADLTDTDRLQATAGELLAASAQRIETENPRIRVVARRLPASEQVRRDAAELAECRTTS